MAQGTEVHGLAQQQRAVDIPQHGTELLVFATGLIPVFNRHANYPFEFLWLLLWILFGKPVPLR
jgi:hypothetical protein